MPGFSLPVARIFGALRSLRIPSIVLEGEAVWTGKEQRTATTALIVVFDFFDATNPPSQPTDAWLRV